ncbi:MAG: AAA family ATPase [candidate division KSB1 bacterium]|nr:AAA family ATPase [candidate division KSB1 bacterium]MDZ7364518.1 AAA family ATPase [candidate division KSB1 bacterium]MDZ7405779.1 AAA family ATPase [candidate division KSB1 bacterium]
MPRSEKPFLIEITLLRDKVPSFEKYPFCLSVVKHLRTLAFHPNVTFLIGENGTGKSTLLEAIAVALRYNPEGGTTNVMFSTRETHSNLHEYLRLSRSSKRPKDGYFLRAESFYNVASYMDDIGYLKSYGGKSLHQQSHGESFLSLLNYKFRGNGLYLLDEPEAALSPIRQLAAMAIIHKLAEANSQFIIVTHSPIIMAYPNARIYHLSESGIQEVKYTETEHYKIAKDFLNRPEQTLRALLDEP